MNSFPITAPRRRPSAARLLGPKLLVAGTDGHTGTTLFGKTVLANAEMKALYELKAEATGTPVFALTVADFLHAPAVEEIDLSGYTGLAGETIRITASDDFEVTGMVVGITGANGTVLEHGPATPTDGVWDYVLTTALPAGQQVTIEVTATDSPGHKTSKVQAKG